jgi:hypothetical protein
VSVLLDWLDAREGALSAVSSLLTSAAILVGGGWALRQYWKRRDPHPKARVRHAVTHRPLDMARTWMRVELSIENCGACLLNLKSGLTRVNQVLPLRGPFPSRMSPPFGRELDWPQLHGDATDWTELRIEPGESDSVSYDFLLAGDVRTVLIYSHVENRSYRHSTIGWQTSTIYHIDESGYAAHASGSQGTAGTEAASDASRQLEGRYTTTGCEAPDETADEGQVERIRKP